MLPSGPSSTSIATVSGRVVPVPDGVPGGEAWFLAGPPPRPDRFVPFRGERGVRLSARGGGERFRPWGAAPDREAVRPRPEVVPAGEPLIDVRLVRDEQ